MARRAHMSARTFVRHYKTETGMPPGQWLTRQRIARARNLLASTGLTVEQIALQVGFATAASLRRHLHAKLGVSPMPYRRARRSSSWLRLHFTWPVCGGI